MEGSIFISYSHKDKKWLEEIKKHLSILEHNFQLLIWDDTKIKIGSHWQESILESIKKCRVAILLVSNNFLASEFILKKELPDILNVARNKGVTVCNVIIDTCAFHLTPLKVYQCINEPSAPIEELKSADRKRVLVQLTTKIAELVESTRLLPGANSMKLDEHEDMFCMTLVTAYLVKNGGQPITSIQNTTGLKRKTVVAVLQKLSNLGFIEKLQGIENKKPSTFWKVSELGTSLFNQFEKSFTSIISSAK